MEKHLLTAVTTEPLPTIGGPGLGPFGEWFNWGQDGQQGAINALQKLTTIISNLVGVMTIVAGLWFMFQFIIAGYNWLTSGGNAEAINKARDRMRDAFIGMLIVAFALTLIGLVGNLLGLDILIQDPGRIIRNLKPS